MRNAKSKMERARALTNGVGIQSLLNAAYEILGNPIAMFNTEYSLQAYTNVPTDDPIWNELITYGTFSYQTQVLFMEEGFVDASANSTTTALMVSDKIKYDRILGKLYNEDNVHVSNLILVASNRPLQEDDEEALWAVCEAFSREIGKSEFYRTYGNIYRETYIRKLIDGEIVEKELYASHIAIIYGGFDSSMRLVAADIGKDALGQSKLAYFRDLFRGAQGKFEYAIYGEHILIIISSESAGWNPRQELGELCDLFLQNDIRAGVSGRFDNLFELKKHYTQALEALGRALQGLGSDGVFVYDDMQESI